MNLGEERFARIMEEKGYTLVSQPAIREINLRPDFFCKEDETYYEVFATRQAYHFRKHKIYAAQRKGYKIRCVDPEGFPYPKIKEKKEVNPRVPIKKYVETLPEICGGEILAYAETFGISVKVENYYECSKCEFSWNPKSSKNRFFLPLECPNCHRYDWCKRIDANETLTLPR